MMTKKEKEFANYLVETLVRAMKETSATTVSTKRGRASATANEGKKTEAPKTKYSTKITDYEPKKVDGFYKWGKKTDTLKSRNYRAMQIAYCYAVATKGQAISSDECLDLGIEVDYADNGAYKKAKAQFTKKFVYTKKADR